MNEPTGKLTPHAWLMLKLMADGLSGPEAARWFVDNVEDDNGTQGVLDLVAAAMLELFIKGCVEAEDLTL